MTRIFIVDDDPTILKLLKEMAQNRGYEVETAVNEDDAETKIKKKKYDVVITDMRMKRNDSGIIVIKMVKEMYPLTPVIVLTAYASIQNVAECMEVGAFSYVEKTEKEDLYNVLFSKVEKALQALQEKETIKHPRPTGGVEMKDSELLYEKYRSKLEKKHQGEFVAINFDTEEIIVGKDDTEILQEAVKKFGKGRFLFKRIGYDYVYSVGVGGGKG